MSSFSNNFMVTEVKTKEQMDMARERGEAGVVKICEPLKTNFN